MIDFGTWKKAWALLDARERRNAWIVLLIVILSALSAALMVGSVLPFLSVLAEPQRIQSVPALAWAYETFGFKSDYGFLIGLGVGSLVIIVLTSAMQIFRTWAVARFVMMRMHSLSCRLLAAYLQQPYEFFLDRHTGEMGTRILAETHQLVVQFLRPATEAVAAMFTIAAVLGLLLWIEPLVAVVALVSVGGVYAFIYWLSRRALKQLGILRAAANSARFRIANEALSGIKDIKLLGRETAYLNRYYKPSHKMAASVSSIQVISIVPKYALELIAFGGIILFCLILMDPQNFSSGEALGGLLPLLGMFAFAGQRLMPELQKLYQSLATMQAGAAAVDLVHDDLFGRVIGEHLQRSTLPGLQLRKYLLLENVSYHYPNSAHAGVSDISLRIRAGEKIGIIGGTGAGKTTLADLILGLLLPHNGRIIADGVGVTEANTRQWQQSVGYVPQDIFLTDASVAENIALGVPLADIDRARVEEASQIARLDQFVRSDLPNGYDTEIGERGLRLSGGQRQRIGIARALYHDADLIVFDEATSALDNATESEVMTSIEALPGDKTVIIIAHRLSTVQACDKIIVLERGRIVGYDKWEVLMAENPAFRRLAKISNAAADSETAQTRGT